MSEMTPTEAAALVEQDRQRRIKAAAEAALVEQDRQRRIKAAAEAVQAALAEHGCDLVALPQIVEGRIVALVQVVAK